VIAMLRAKKVVVVTGAGGLIGHALMTTAPVCVPGWDVHGLTRQRLDLTDTTALQALFRELRPRLIIHCAALSKSEPCEQNPALARALNVAVTVHLAELAREMPFIFLSTDLVFDGRAGHYDEAARINPLSVYGKTKAEAERIVLANPRHTVVRTSLNGGTSPTGDRGFNEELRRAWQAGRALTLFTDEFRCPLPAVVTARALWELALKEEAGLYHVAGAERLSRWQIGRLLAHRWPQLNPKIEPASRRDYSGPLRPADTSLSCAKVQKLLSFPLPGLTDWLAAHPEEIF
jgi:dTDP-4-dehydrorhamnose reductase